MIENYARHDYREIASHLPLDNCQHILDVGGGTGVLAKYLVDHYPHLRVTVLDRPEVVQLGQSQLPKEYHDRIRFVVADLFEPWPCEGDGVILARVLHDWSDERALQILQRAYEALADGGHLYILEYLLQEEGYAGYLCDLHLLMCLGGRERTLEGYDRLLRDGGFRFQEVIPLPSIASLIYATKGYESTF